jgi:hypothetical protein
MDDILDVLVAHGVPGATIVRVAQLIADAQQTQRMRDTARERMQRVRERSRKHPNTHEHKSPLSLEEKKEGLSRERKGVRGKPTLIPLPDDWQPKGPQRDPTEAEEFRDKARAKAWTYANWDAAYRNFQKSEYNARNKNGVQPAADLVAGQKALEEYLKRDIWEQTNGKKPEARLRPDTGLGQARPGDENQLRLAGGRAHGDQVEGREIADAISAVARNLRTG